MASPCADEPPLPAAAATLSQWLNNIEQLHPQTIALGLERIKGVAQSLNLCQFSVPVIMVAGTNGKGSTLACLERIYAAAGYRTALYTSPHLVDFNERLRLNESPLSDEAWVAAFSVINQARKTLPLTFFEFTTLAALYALSQQPVDIILLEIGLGGRLDAVNCVEPSLSVITNIDLDHQALLGDSREAIGREKAGIMRAARPVISGDPYPPQSVVDTARALGAELIQLGRDVFFEVNTACWSWRNASTTFTDLPHPKLLHRNAAITLAVIERLQGERPVPRAAIQQGLETVTLAGRCQRFAGSPEIVLDVAHNAQSTQQLRDFLRRHYPGKRIASVFSALADKPIDEMIRTLMDTVQAWYIAPNDSARSASLKDLQKTLVECEQHYYSNETIQGAYSAAVTSSHYDVVVVWGSFYTVGVILKELNSKESV